jgi:hypothetical protein
MKTKDTQLGKPGVLYKNTKAAVEALTGVTEGAAAYATDTNEFGTYNGSTWDWARTIFADMTDPTGFVNRTSSTIGFVDATRVFTITPSTSFAIYLAGVRYIKSSPETVTISTTVGMHYIYYSTAGVLSEMTTVWDINSANVPVATVYWNGSAGLLGDERHGIQMDGQTHERLHETVGAAYAYGLAGTFAANGSTITIGAGEWYDDDIEVVTTEQTTCRVYWLNGTTWNWTAAQAAYFHAVSSAPQYNNGGSLADVSTAKYSISWVYMTNHTSTPVAVIMGQAEYNTQALAEAAGVPNLSTLPSAEMVLLYRVIWQRNGAVITWIRTDDYRRVYGGASANYLATDHGALSGLADDDHTQYLTEARGDARYRVKLTADRTYYVRTDGSDSNTGLANTAGGAFLTIQKAVDVSTTLDLSGYNLVIQVGDGTYTGAVTLKNIAGFWGAGSLTLRGNTSTPANCIISTTSATCITASALSSTWIVTGFKFQTTTSGACILVSNSAVLGISAIEFGASAAQHMYASRGGVLNVSSNYTISGGASYHMLTNYQGRIECASFTCTVAANVTITYFAAATYLAFIVGNGMTYSLGAYAVTGTRYLVTSGAIIYTNSGGASYYPGTVGGSTATNGQYL